MIEDTADLIGQLRERERAIKIERARLDAEFASISAAFDVLGVKRRGRPPGSRNAPGSKRPGRKPKAQSPRGHRVNRRTAVGQ